MKNITFVPKMGLFYKIACLVLFTLIIAIGVSTAVSINEETKITRTALIQKNKIISNHLGSSIRNAFWSLNWLFVEKQMQEIAESKDVTFLELIKPNGEVYMASGDKVPEEGLFVRELMNLEKQVLKDGLYSRTGGQTKVIITPIKVGDDKWVLIMGVSLKEVEEAKKSILKENIAWGGGILLLGVFVSFWFARGMTRPIKQLVEGTKEIGRGNLDYRINIKGLDELGELAGSFNDMAEDLKNTTTSRDLLAAEIKERKQAEQALRESEERFRIAAESASDLIYEWDIATDHLEWFGDIDGVLGFNPGEFERTIEAWLALIHPDDQDRLAGEVNHHRESGKPINTEYSIRRNDGTWRYWTDRGLAIMDDTGEPYRLIGVCTDITDRKQAEEALRESEKKYRLLVENTMEGIVVIQDGKAVFFNPRTLDFGYSPDEIRAMPFIEFIHPDDRKESVERYLKLASGQKIPERREFRVIAKSGSVLWIRSNSVMVEWNGKPAVLTFLSEITERKRAEEALQRSHDELEMRVEERTAEIARVNQELRAEITERKWLEAQLIQSAKMASLGMMAGGIAHELRNPLGVCSSAAQLLVENPENRVLREQCADKIYSNVHRASRIIEDLLKFARGSGEDLWPLNLDEVLEATLSLIEHQIAVQEIELSKEFAQDLPPVIGNCNLLQQVFLNIILNACNAMPGGGKLSLSTGVNPEGKAEILFADTGCGIPADELNKVFDPFFTTMPAGRGTGLGLSVSYGIIQQHGGAIEVESTMGVGTTFKVILKIEN